jgi:hypothetical protein
MAVISRAPGLRIEVSNVATGYQTLPPRTTISDALDHQDQPAQWGMRPVGHRIVAEHGKT